MSIIEAPEEIIGAMIAAIEDEGYQSVAFVLADGRRLQIGTCACCGLDSSLRAPEVKP